MSVEWVRCPSCKARVGASHARCPRCRAHLVVEAPSRVHDGKKLKVAALCVAAAFAVLVTGLWVTRAEPTADAPVNDPLQARRAKAAASPAPAVRTAEDMPIESRPLFQPEGSRNVSQNAIAAQAVAVAALRENPDNVAALENLGVALIQLNEPAKAIVHLERATRLAPGQWGSQFHLARAHAQMGHWSEAAAALQAARAQKPEDFVTSFDLALALHRSGNDEAAIDEYRRAIALGPRDGTFYRSLAISLQRTHRYADAVRAYQDYLRLSPDASDAEQITQRIARLQAMGQDDAAGASSAQKPGR